MAILMTTPSPDIRRNAIIGLVLAVFMVGLDQGIKITVEMTLPFQQAVDVLPFLALFYTFNTGIAFSFMDNLSPVTLVIIAFGVVLIMLFLWWQARGDGLLPALGYGMILGGAVGNIIDRTLYGHVIDYVLVHWGQWSFAVFNLADAALSVGVVTILLSGFVPARISR